MLTAIHLIPREFFFAAIDIRFYNLRQSETIKINQDTVLTNKFVRHSLSGSNLKSGKL